MNQGLALPEIDFYFIKPTTPLPRGFGRIAGWLRRGGIDLEILNTKLPLADRELKIHLRELGKMPKMSTFAIAVIIHRIVSHLPEDEAFVNVGLWRGYTFLAGLVNHPDKLCIGVDNFSEFDGPRQQFTLALQRYQNPRQRVQFFNMDCFDYFQTQHRAPIGFYIYDGEHSYENKLKGLEAAEPFFAPGCMILVDDTNWEEPRQI